jgi:hypothetical protein
MHFRQIAFPDSFLFIFLCIFLELASGGKMKRKVAWAGAGLVVYAGAAWGVYQYLRPSNECASTCAATTANGVPEGVWEGLAGGYDAAVDRDERVTGVLKRRAALLSSHARGHVLEIACGTGTFISFFIILLFLYIKM